MNDTHQVFLVNLGLIALGLFSKKKGWITRDGSAELAKIVLNLSLPAAILSTLLSNPLPASFLNFTYLGILYNILLFIIFYIAFRTHNNSEKGIASITLFGMNAGLFGFPLIHSLYGDKGLLYFLSYDIFNAFIIFGLSYILAFKYSEGNKNQPVTITASLKMLTSSIPFVCYVVGLILNVTEVKIPTLPLALFDVVKRANPFLVFFILGTFLDFKAIRGNVAFLLKVIAVRYLLFGTVATILYFTLKDKIADPFELKMLILVLALPTSLSSLPYSTKFKYDRGKTGLIANSTIVVSFILFWILTSVFPA